MKYTYTSFYIENRPKAIKRPMIEIEVFGSDDSKTFDALIDSGADVSLFNLEIAEALGIDLTNAKSANFIGIAGNVDGYRVDKTKIKVNGFSNTVEIPACFVDSPSVGILLGQDGFFDLHRIKFEKDHDTFEITSAKK